MVALNREARWSVIQISANLSRQLAQLAKQVALANKADEISPDHVKVAVEQITGDNTTLLQCLLDEVGVPYGERQAG